MLMLNTNGTFFRLVKFGLRFFFLVSVLCSANGYPLQ